LSTETTTTIIDTLEDTLPVEQIRESSIAKAHQPANSLIAKVSQPTRWSQKQKSNTDISKIPEDWRIYNTIQNSTQSLGSRVEFRHDPDHLLKNPPEDASLELLMANQAHMGHHTSLWNPSNSRYIYGVREGIHIISLEQTAAHLRRAARVVEGVAYYGGIILFVGNRKGHMPIVTRAAELAGACHLFSKWTPGAITNRDQILGGMEMQIVDELDRPLEGFDKHLMDRRPVVPDLVVCLNPLENYPLLKECTLANIPTIGVIDTNADPTLVTYVIPANDDSLRAATVIAGVLGQAGKRGRDRRLKEAENGQVTWQNPQEVRDFLTQEKKAQEAAAAELAGQKTETETPQDMDGVMNAAQLEAFQLLQELERERRSKGKRGGKKAEEEDED
jgi:small subunit ribosomal protein S2